MLCSLGERIDATVNDRVRALAEAVRASALPGIVDVVPAYTAFVVHYEPLRWTHGALAPAVTFAAALDAWLNEHANEHGKDARTTQARGRERRVPVVYGGRHGPDLDVVARHVGTTADDVVQRHASALYTVAFLGFAPGFPYLLGLDPELATPRRATPRTRVEPGAVGIADAQTGIYPLATPGGWQIIGKTPRRLFDPTRSPPTWLNAGDRVRFVPIDAARFDAEEGAWDD